MNLETDAVPMRLDDLESWIQDQFVHIPELVVRYVQFGDNGCRRAVLLFMDNMTDKPTIENRILLPLFRYEGAEATPLQAIVAVGRTSPTAELATVQRALFAGNAVLIEEGAGEALVLGSPKPGGRSPDEPTSEFAYRGSHLGFVEQLDDNTAMLRRYLPQSELKVEYVNVGRRGAVRAAVIYLSDVADESVVSEFKRRIRLIDTDSILNIGEMMEWLEERPFSLLPQFLITERPDSAASHLLQGRVAVMMDRATGALIGPATFMSFFQTLDDYNSRWQVASFIRVLRIVGSFIALYLPSFYIAALSFHYEIIPVDLILSIGRTRERVPLPPLLEAFLMELILEMLRESGLRLPNRIGQTVGIVGGIVIGQAAVEAGIVSNIMVIVVSLTAISSFIVPNPDMAAAIRLIRFPTMIAASIFGLVGIVVSIMLLVAHLISLETLKTPYGSPFYPIHLPDWKDTFVRLPSWMMKTRPVAAQAKQLIRRKGRSADDEP
ncbi:spore germination protein [Paenibacillus flagellatus]|uniref:Spore germination protein n=1 Tax=Paenibacillus flagellatus TaxID=2211139 RepID=A0A2V5L2J0_9BACL|nr:spore germination protein [Paenibacillus flagellatus]PYI56916.1 spore germination protein [Paenibacillus flagellatus]